MEKYKLLEGKYLHNGIGKPAATYYYFVDEKGKIINYKTLKPYRGKQMDIYAIFNRRDAINKWYEINKPYLPKMIAKKDMKPGMWYKGICRNNYVAWWDAKKEEFVYIRPKFGYLLDTIKHFEDVAETRQDGFIPVEEITFLDYKLVNKIKEELDY